MFVSLCKFKLPSNRIVFHLKHLEITVWYTWQRAYDLEAEDMSFRPSHACADWLTLGKSLHPFIFFLHGQNDLTIPTLQNYKQYIRESFYWFITPKLLFECINFFITQSYIQNIADSKAVQNVKIILRSKNCRKDHSGFWSACL